MTDILQRRLSPSTDVVGSAVGDETVELTLGQAYATHGTGLALVSAEPGKIAGATPSLPASLFGFEAR